MLDNTVVTAEFDDTISNWLAQVEPDTIQAMRCPDGIVMVACIDADVLFDLLYAAHKLLPEGTPFILHTNQGAGFTIKTRAGSSPAVTTINGVRVRCRRNGNGRSAHS